MSEGPIRQSDMRKVGVEKIDLRKFGIQSVPEMAGFRQNPDGPGLYLPNEISRTREVWTKDEWKLLNRAQKLIQARGMTMILKCDHEACKAVPVEKIRQGDGFVLRCGHADRVFQKAF